MIRLVFSLLAGGVFGAGLMVSGMVDTVKVQGFLDIFGAWNPTLAFVMGGAMLPMAVAWRMTGGQAAGVQTTGARGTSVLGAPLPGPAKTRIGPNLIAGSVLFGMGWALVGLCPGPALASLSFGGWGGLAFIIAMAAAMVVAPLIRDRIEPKARRSKMDIRALTPNYAVSPQISPDDLAVIKAAGFTTVIDNRPDGEISADLAATEMQRAAEALGLTFVINPLMPGAFTPENVAVQLGACTAAAGPVFAYCASGNRCSIVWAMMNAGTLPVDDLIATPARFGYNLNHLRPTLEALSAK